MTNKSSFAIALLVAVAAGNPGLAQEGANTTTDRAPLSRLSGTFNDYVWVEADAGQGAWHVTGGWTARLKHRRSKGDFVASLHGVRSDAWALDTNADPADPAVRTPHSHHVGLLDADVTALPNGIRLEGVARITANGSEALYSNSTVRVDITGGSSLRFSNVQLTFFGDASEHFGPQPWDGVVVLKR
jgi:hypothetical protein